MGMTRKLLSASTAGAVSFRSPKERQAAAAQKDARANKKLAKAEAALLKEQARALKRENDSAEGK